MPGAKTEFDATYVTSPRLYRTVTAIDALGPGDDGIPEIRLDLDDDRHSSNSGAGTATRVPGAKHGWNAQLFLYVVYATGGGCVDVGTVAGPSDTRCLTDLLNTNDPRCQAILRVWVKALVPDGRPNPDETPGSSGPSWCIVHEQSIVVNTFIPLRNLPANRYKVTVDFLKDATDVVEIIESHTV